MREPSQVPTDAERPAAEPTIGGPTYEKLTPGSRQARDTAHERLPTGISRQTLYFDPYPIFARRGTGAYVEDLDGRLYLDFVNNYTSLIHGHAHAPTVQATCAAIEASAAPGAPTELEFELAAELGRRFPGLEWLRFVVSGSEAVSLALRAARAFTGRTRLLKFEGGFHGYADDVQVGVSPTAREAGTFGPGQPLSRGLAPVETLVAVYNDIASVDAVFAAHGGELAAVIIEPFLGNAGLVPVDSTFLRHLAERCRQAGTLLILDEIQSCRLAYGGAQASYDVTPDLTTLGKTIGGGMPLAAFGGRREVMAGFDGGRPDIVQTGTFAAFPASLASGLATLAHWGRPEIDHLNANGSRLRDEIRSVFAEHGLPAWINGEGSMFSLAITESPVTTYRAFTESDRSTLDRIHLGLLARGVYLTARGSGCLSSPMNDADLDMFLAALRDTIRTLPAR